MAGVNANIRTFIAPLRGPGRIAPTLIEDLTVYDPRLNTQPNCNILQDPPLDFVSASHLGELLPSKSCTHDFRLKPKQSLLPVLDERPGPTTIWVVGAFCVHCRTHLSLKVDYSIRWEDQPCPNASRAVHHFVQSSWREDLARSEWRAKYPDSDDEIYVYECSSRTCSATVTAQLSPADIDEDSVKILTDKDLLKQRTEDAFRVTESTEGMAHPSVTNVLSDLRTYLRNSWKQGARPISVTNKRFVARFGPGGEACRDVLEGLRFTFQTGGNWLPPQPNLEDLKEPMQDRQNIFIDNVEHELSVLILQRDAEERQQAQDTTKLIPVEQEFYRALSCQNYDKHPSSRAQLPIVLQRPRTFQGLGATFDAADRLVIQAYEDQCRTWPAGGPYFLEYLEQIATQRNSEELLTALATEMSQGKVSAAQLANAYNFLNLNIMDNNLNDDFILNTFEARLADSRAQEQDLRDSLKVIGRHRNSKRIVQRGENSLNTYEEALDWLGASPDTADDFIQPLYSTKVADDASAEEQARKAVSIIASHRSSSSLKAWISSGFSANVSTEMDVSDAYQALGADRSIDDDLVLTSYDLAISDNPGNADYYKRALGAIAHQRDSPLLMRHLREDGQEPPWSYQPPQVPVDEPVGLENIGNTCYLNSLLQYLFTISTIRDIVLNFDKYKMDISDARIGSKRVGQRHISVREVERSQKFVAQLARLFEEMIQSPKAAVKPQQELARLTLETDGVQEKIRRRSTIMSDTGRPSLGHVDSQAFVGPVNKVDTQADGATDAMVQSPVADDETFSMDNLESTSKHSTIDPSIVMHDDIDNLGRSTVNSSELTLVSERGSDEMEVDLDPLAERPDLANDKENISPPKGIIREQIPAADHVAVGSISPDVPSKLHSQVEGVAQDEDIRLSEQSPSKAVTFAPPKGPPPVPPRKPVETTTHTIEEYARQQDVPEVVDHCLFQMSCAMRPTGTDSAGEQMDEIHDLFFGQTQSHTVPEKETADTAVPILNILASISQQPEDVYQAIDTYFDLSDNGNGTETYLSMSRLPPIIGVHLNRVTWNDVNKRAEKSNHHVKLLHTVFMDRYLESPIDSKLTLRRKQMWAQKAEMKKLVTRRIALEAKPGTSQDIPSILGDARYVLSSLADLEATTSDAEGMSIDESSLEVLEQLEKSTRKELDELRERMDNLSGQLRESFSDSDMLKHPYKLHAAFFHRGTSGSGHYWVYIYDHKKELWRKYNDDHVTVLNDFSEIFAKPDEANAGYGGPPNPYFLIYVQDDNIPELVETVKRDVVFPPAEAAPPVPPRSGQAMSQIEALPPTDVEMMEANHSWAVNAGEHSQDADVSQYGTNLNEPGTTWPPREDDSELTHPGVRW